MTALFDQLAGIVGESHVLVDPDLRAPYETDWTRRFTGTARCVVRPASTAEVAAVVRACADAGAPIVVQGGNTGLVNGGVPFSHEVLVSVTRLVDLEPVDVLEAQVTGCSAELYVNDIPVTQVGVGQASSVALPVNHYLATGANTLALLVNPGPTPASA